VRAWTEEVRGVLDPIPLGSAVNFSGVLGYYWHKDFQDKRSGYTVRGCNESGCAPRGYGIGFAAAGLWPNDQDWIVPDDDSYSVDSSFYGEIDFKFFDHLTLTAGDRYYRLTSFNAGVSNWYGATAGALDPTPAIPGTRKDTGHSPRFSATYAFNPDASVYLQAARGFRQGFASSANQVLPATCDQDLIDLGFDPAKGTGYGPDSIWNYEAGTKFRLRNPNMILSAAVYDMEWSNIQQNITLACFYGFTSNSGAATSRGGELEATINPVEGLSIHFAGGYEDAHITTPAFGTTQMAGDRLKLVPKYTGSAGFMYTFPTAMNFGGASGNLFISSDYSYTGDRLSTNSSSRYTVTIPSYYQINARLGMQFENSELALNVDNVTNGRNNLTDYVGIGWGIGERGTIFGANRFVPLAQFFVSQPRTWTLQYSHHM